MASDMSSRTVGGLNAYCDWLLQKHYAGPSQIGPWKIAIRKVFEAVNGPTFEETSLDGIDWNDLFRRFRIAAAQTYKSETMDAYISRVQRAVEAYEFWQQNGKPPVFRQLTRKAEKTEQGESATAKVKTKPKSSKATTLKVAEPEEPSVAEPGFIEYPFPLRNGQIAKLMLPPRLEKQDVDRMVQLLHALSFEPQPQIPEKTGQQEAA